MTFDEALAAVTPVLGAPDSVVRDDGSDPESVGYSRAYWFGGADMYRDGYTSLNDEDGIPFLWSHPPDVDGKHMQGAGWIVDVTTAADDPRAEGSIIADPVTAAKAALAFRGVTS